MSTQESDVVEELAALWKQKIHEARNGGKETATRVHCARCGTRFKPTVTQLRRAARTDRVRNTSVNGELYCSRVCWIEARTRNDPCEQCGTPFRRPRHEEQRYCSQACGAKAQERKVEVPCTVCGTPVVRTPGHLARHKPTCSPRCGGIVAQGMVQRIEKPCARCGKTMSLVPSESARRYCSRSCYQDTAIQRPCQQCGRPFKVVLGRQGTARFCSRACAGAARRKT